MQNKDTKGSKKLIVPVEARFGTILPDFLATGLEDLKSMVMVLEQGDYETIRIFGHGMKGTGGIFGLDPITDMGNSLEKAANNKNSEEIGTLLRDFLTYLEQLEVVYQ